MSDPLRRRTAPIGLLVALALALAGCSSGGDTAATTAPPTTRATTTTAPPTTTTTTAPTTTTTAPPTPPTTSDPFAGPPVWAPPYEPLGPVADTAPLTGRAFDGDADPAAAVLAVKVDNHPSSRPPTALEEADVVFEENVEGVTRFVALFHAAQPEVVGPVRSARTGDLPLLAALNRPILAWSGGNPYVRRAVANAADAGVLVDRGEPDFPDCYRRDRSRSRPHNLYLDVGCARGSAPDAGPARPLWAFGPLPAGMASAESTGVQVVMDGVVVTWTWDAGSGRYLRAQGGRRHLAASSTQLAAENVVVMTVQYGPSPADQRSPEAQTLGSGPVVVHREGRSVAGTWHRGELTDAFTFVDASGATIPLVPGTTFVELARP